MAKPAVSVRSAKGGLRQYLAHTIGCKDVPAPADRQLIGEMVSWWMKHDPLDASRRIVDAVGLGALTTYPNASG